MKRRIAHHSEEFDCPTCGYPLYVGDEFVAASENSWLAACSWKCLKTYIAAEEEFAAALEATR